MNLSENKQYNFSYRYNFPNGGEKLIHSSLFLYEDKIYIVSSMENKPVFKSVYNKKTKELLAFENYRSDLITCSGKTINKLTEVYSKILGGDRKNIKEENLDNQLIEDFSLKSLPFSIAKKEMRYAFRDHESRNKGYLENLLYKEVIFNNVYARNFNKYENNYHFYLNLFKNKNEFIYCITTSDGKKLCKFVFENENDINIFNLVHRENYIKEAEQIDFNILNKDFGHIIMDDIDMHDDIANEKIPVPNSVRHSYFPLVFKDIPKLPLLIQFDSNL